MDKDGRLVGTDFEAQAEQAFKNIDAILREVGADWEDVCKLNMYLLDIGNLSKLSEVAEKYLKGVYPAQTVVEVKKLALPELQLEIEAIAVIP
jgi:enamine deaminase RidA (YjgF/YER057c/UK114 family)